MILSMTGYGKGTASNGKWNVDTEVKSINSRYLEVFIKYPPVLATKEYEIRELVKSKIKRGKLNLSIQIKKNGFEDEAVSFNEEKLKEYLALIKKIKKTAKLSDKIKLDHILMSKDILIAPLEEISEKDFECVKSSINASLDSLIKMKKAEGSELEKDLKKRIKSISKYLASIEEKAESEVSEHFIKYKEKIKSLLEDNANINNERLETELALIAERADITEECVRLRSHIKFFIDSMNKDDDPGRKLNFLCQEMNREANTISAKTLSTSISHSSVYIKEEIERIREQIQNIE
ncbi:MAG: YicC family protein [Ignavibacterium sp.]|nr:YicC family protein [Ignavibacterium sp.]MDX9713694.1 YicC/YloC family endoribonuclease [Ignavibacteriaceae bacterium]GIK22442.1 MAG: YicC family protein [Ignavibacteriota bacterium]